MLNRRQFHRKLYSCIFDTRMNLRLPTRSSSFGTEKKKKKKKKKEERSDEQLRTLSLVQKRKRMHGRKRNRHGCKRAHTSYLYTENSGVLAFGSSVVTAVKQCRDNSGFTRVPSSVLKLTTSRPFLNPSWSHFFLSSFFFFAPLSLSLSLSFITLPHIISKGLSGKGGRSI